MFSPELGLVLDTYTYTHIQFQYLNSDTGKPGWNQYYVISFIIRKGVMFIYPAKEANEKKIRDKRQKQKKTHKTC